jgi:thiamine-phosphate pyrophosphorylase
LLAEDREAMEARIYSAIDANINRSLEGIRVCEDIFRFIIRNSEISVKLKEIRHAVVEAFKSLSSRELLHGRDVENDSQKYYDVNSEKTRDSLHDLVKSNLHRAMEAIRSLEEFFKLLHPDMIENQFQKIRFSLYSLEKDMISVLLREDKRKNFSSSLYAILDSSFVRKEDYLKTAKRLISGGASIIQLRLKNIPMGKVLETAKIVSRVCKESGVLFIVNDYPEIAYLSGADGVHLGQDDLPVTEVRRIFPPDMIIGISTHSRDEARLALQHEPDYITVGPVYETKSKDNKILEGIGEDVLIEVLNSTEISVVAIGGLNPERIGRLKKSGCNCCAALSYLYKDITKEHNIEENCRAILNSMKS